MIEAFYILVLIFLFNLINLSVQSSILRDITQLEAIRIEQNVFNWRQVLSKNYELNNRESQTAALVVKHLQSLIIFL